MDLPIDNLQIIFNFLPIPDKRNLIRINLKCNTLAYLISNASNDFLKNLPTYTTSYKYYTMLYM